MLKQSSEGLKKYTAKSDTNTMLVLDSSPLSDRKPHQLEWIGVKYSSAMPNHTGIFVEIVSEDGTDFGTLLLMGNADDQFLFYQPDADLHLESGDVVRVTAPAAGGQITSAITIQMRERDSS